MKTAFFRASSRRASAPSGRCRRSGQKENAEVPAGASQWPLTPARRVQPPRSRRSRSCRFVFLVGLAGSGRAACPARSLSTIGRSSAKLRRSPLTEYCRAGNVTLRPPVLRSQTAKPISFSPSSGPPEKCSSASASLPGGLPLSFGKNLDGHGCAPPRAVRRLSANGRGQAAGPARRGGVIANRVASAGVSGRMARRGDDRHGSRPDRRQPAFHPPRDETRARDRGWSVAEQEHLRHGERLGMRDGERANGGPSCASARRGAAVQPQLRRTAGANDLDVLPEHAARVPGAERLHRGLFRREPAGQVRHGVSVPRTIGDLSVGEDRRRKRSP